MASHHVRAVLDSTLRSGLKPTAIVFAYYANAATDLTWPSIKTIAEDLGGKDPLDRSGVKRNTRELERLHVLQAVSDRRGGRGNSVRYLFRLDTLRALQRTDEGGSKITPLMDDDHALDIAETGDKTGDVALETGDQRGDVEPENGGRGTPRRSNTYEGEEDETRTSAPRWSSPDPERAHDQNTTTPAEILYNAVKLSVRRLSAGPVDVMVSEVEFYLERGQLTRGLFQRAFIESCVRRELELEAGSVSGKSS